MYQTTKTAKTNLSTELRKVCQLWAPPPKLTVTEWADEHRRLSAESAAEHGKYRSARTPYAREIQDAFNDPRVKEVVVMSSAQVGKTTILENVIAYHIVHNPMPIMAVFPTAEVAEMASKERFSPMIRDNPSLASRVAEANARSSGNTINKKRFPGGFLAITGANSPKQLRSRPAGLALGDEVDGWDDTKEGDPTELLAARTKQFPNSKLGWFSTPTDEQSRINSKFLMSDQRHYYVPCPHCQEAFVLRFEHLKWTEGDPVRRPDGRQIRRAADAWFECPTCKGIIRDVQRSRAISDGEWRAHEQFHGVAGFWLWEAMNPTSRAIDMASRWLGALGDVEKVRAITNTMRGEVYRESGDVVDWRRLYERSESYPIATVPEGAKALFAGVDVQKNRLEVYVWGYGPGQEHWLIDHHIIEGMVTDEKTWAKLDEFMPTTYPSASGAQLPIQRLAIDSGYEPAKVYEWARKYPPERVLIAKGDGSGNTFAWRSKNIEFADPSGRKIRLSHSLWMYASPLLIDQLYAWLAQDPPTKEQLASGEQYPAGYCHTPSMPEEFFRQLTADVKIGGKYKDKINHERNEALDCWKLARMAAFVMGADRWKKDRFEAIAARYAGDTSPQQPTAAPQASAPRAGRRRGLSIYGGW